MKIHQSITRLINKVLLTPYVDKGYKIIPIVRFMYSLLNVLGSYAQSFI